MNDGQFYPNVANIDGREQFERLLRGDVGFAPIGREVVLRQLTNEKTPSVRRCWLWSVLEDDSTGAWGTPEELMG